jgi:hypothetical protein
MDPNLLPILEKIKELHSEVHEMRQLVHLHIGQIRGLSSYCNSRISQLCAHERDVELNILEEYIKTAYNEYIGSVEDEDPELAALIDIRGTLPDGEQDSWYRLS